MENSGDKMKVEKNVVYRGKAVVVPAEGKIPYDASVWQVNDRGDYINTLTGEIREEDGFDWAGTGGSSEGDGSGDWDEYAQDSGDFDGASFKTGSKKQG